MEKANSLNGLINVFFIIGISAAISACGGGGSSGGKPAVSSATSVTSTSSSSSNTSSFSSSSVMLTLMGGAIQGAQLPAPTHVSTFAGTKAWLDGSASLARFNRPSGIASDGINLYIADAVNSTIRKIVIETGEVSTLAGSVGKSSNLDDTGLSARFSSPADIATDGTNLYVADWYTIRKIVIATGEVTTLAGKAGEIGSADGVGNHARFHWAQNITIDGSNLYVTDKFNHTVRKIVIATGEVSTFSGKLGVSGHLDGTGAEATFSNPGAITTDGTNLYIADTSSSTIRKVVIETGEVSTLAGNAYDRGNVDGVGINAKFKYPSGLTTDGIHLYVSDSDGNSIRKIKIDTGEVSTLAGTDGVCGATDAESSPASFCGPQGILIQSNSLYLSDSRNHIIRKLELDSGVVSTFAGVKNGTDGVVAAASFDYPKAITFDGDNFYIADANNHTVRKIERDTGIVTTVAGVANQSGSIDGVGTNARFLDPRGITTDGTNLYLADSGNGTIRKIVIATGEVTTIAGNVGENSDLDGTGTDASFYYPEAITTDNTNLYVVGNNTVRKIVIATGEVSTIAGLAGENGDTDGVGTEVRFWIPSGVTTDGNNLYVTDTLNNSVRKIAITSGEVSTLAGLSHQFGGVNGEGVNATFSAPKGITTDGHNLYVTDLGWGTIRKIVIASGVVSTVAGSLGNAYGTEDEPKKAGFWSPQGIVTDGISLFVLDSGSQTIRKIE